VKRLQHPLALQKLAQFVLEAHQSLSKKNIEKPFVMAIRKKSRGTMLVVGVLGNQKVSESSKNDFGTRFRNACELGEVKAKHDGFETSYIEISQNDFQKFMHELSSS
jgi:hypothetical protein